jgi:4-hydroxyphenylpyruvate dioxygenase-like putative hemolysin
MSARESWTNRQGQREEATPCETPALTSRLNAARRCDRCGAQAYVRVLLHTRQDLLFCAHHYRQHAPALAKVAAQIQDQTERLARAERPGWPS